MALRYEGVTLRRGVLERALQDAITSGAGWVRVCPYGSIQHVSYRQIQDHGNGCESPEAAAAGGGFDPRDPSIY